MKLSQTNKPSIFISSIQISTVNETWRIFVLNDDLESGNCNSENAVK